jgi:hypothetical protein
MEGIAVGIGEELTALRELSAGFGDRVRGLLALAGGAGEADGDATGMLLEAIDEVGRCAQAREGELVLLLAQADRLRGRDASLCPFRCWVWMRRGGRRCAV